MSSDIKTWHALEVTPTAQNIVLATSKSRSVARLRRAILTSLSSRTVSNGHIVPCNTHSPQRDAYSTR